MFYLSIVSLPNNFSVKYIYSGDLYDFNHKNKHNGLLKLGFIAELSWAKHLFPIEKGCWIRHLIVVDILRAKQSALIRRPSRQNKREMASFEKTVDDRGWTPLHIEARSGNLNEVVRF